MKKLIILFFLVGCTETNKKTNKKIYPDSLKYDIGFYGLKERNWNSYTFKPDSTGKEIIIEEQTGFSYKESIMNTNIYNGIVMNHNQEIRSKRIWNRIYLELFYISPNFEFPHFYIKSKNDTIFVTYKDSYIDRQIESTIEQTEVIHRSNLVLKLKESLIDNKFIILKGQED